MKEFNEYPKWINQPGTESGGLVVFSKEEEEKYVLQEEKDTAEEVKRRGRPRKVQ